MPRVLLVPAVGAWSFSIDQGQLPFTLLLPASAKAGEIIFTAQTNGSTPNDPEGVIGSVVIDGAPPIDTACLSAGSESIAVPANTVEIEVSAAFGCNAGPDTTTLTISGVGA